MPSNLNAPFDPAYCEGGATSDGNSCQPCGCDPAANWICERHRYDLAAIKDDVHWILKRVPITDNLDYLDNQLRETLNRLYEWSKS